jgi:hypothetical protein
MSLASVRKVVEAKESTMAGPFGSFKKVTTPQPVAQPPAPNQFFFDWSAIALALIKLQDIHDGFWQVDIKFSHLTTLITDKQSGNISPGSVSVVNNIVLTKVAPDKDGNLPPMTLDAAAVNPKEQDTGLVAPDGRKVRSIKAAKGPMPH